jgi:hypothetical protein
MTLPEQEWHKQQLPTTSSSSTIPKPTYAKSYDIPESNWETYGETNAKPHNSKLHNLHQWQKSKMTVFTTSPTHTNNHTSQSHHQTTLLMNETCISLLSHPLTSCHPWDAHLYWWLYKFLLTSHWTKKQSNHRGINVSPMNPEADLSICHVNLYGSELKLLLLLLDTINA